jgi:hypothetical protein
MIDSPHFINTSLVQYGWVIKQWTDPAFMIRPSWINIDDNVIELKNEIENKIGPLLDCEISYDKKILYFNLYDHQKVMFKMIFLGELYRTIDSTG